MKTSQRPVDRVLRAAQGALRRALSPLLPWVPDGLANRLPWLGRISATMPNGNRLRMFCDGPGGKCYIARKIAGRSVCDYEPETMRVFLSLLVECRVMIDVGANSGIFALLAAKLDGRRTVHAFEPAPHIFQRLGDNVRLNRLENVVLRDWAVGCRSGAITLHVPITRWSLPTSASTAAGLFAETQAIEVRLVDLDEYVRREGIGRVDLLKIDTETTEHEVLAGARALLERDEPAIIAEVLPNSPAAAELSRILSGTSYQYFHVETAGLVPASSIVGDASGEARNYLFITQRRIECVKGLIVPAEARRVA